MKINLINILHALVVWQSLLFAIVLMTPKFRARRSNTYLALLLVTIGLHFSYNILYTNQILLNVLNAYSCSYGFLYGPLMLLYTRFYLLANLRFTWVDALHFLPVSLVVALTGAGYPVCNHLGIPLILVMLLYCVLSYRVIWLYESGVVQVYAKNETAQTAWIKLMLILMVFILLVNMLQFRYESLDILGWIIHTETLVQLGILVLINLISYQGLKSPILFQKISNHDMAFSKPTQRPKDNQELRALEVYAKRIDEQVIQRRLYLDAELNLRQLAAETNLHEKSVSKAINAILQSNFSSYINQYRIDHALALIESDKDLSIKEVMFKSGFNSRSVFNTFFKQKTGHTPSAYRRLILKKRSDS